VSCLPFSSFVAQSAIRTTGRFVASHRDREKKRRRRRKEKEIEGFMIDFEARFNHNVPSIRIKTTTGGLLSLMPKWVAIE
jgi:hypothetical protein